MIQFKKIEHTADLAYEVYGKDLRELFYSAYKAWQDSSMTLLNYSDIDTKYYQCDSNSIEELLVDFLSELNYFLFVKKWACISVKNLLIEKKDSCKLNCEFEGITISESNITIRSEIKAVTFHKMKIIDTNGMFSTKIIFDV